MKGCLAFAHIHISLVIHLVRNAIFLSFFFSLAKIASFPLPHVNHGVVLAIICSHVNLSWKLSKRRKLSRITTFSIYLSYLSVFLFLSSFFCSLEHTRLLLSHSSPSFSILRSTPFFNESMAVIKLIVQPRHVGAICSVHFHLTCRQAKEITVAEIHL